MYGQTIPGLWPMENNAQVAPGPEIEEDADTTVIVVGPVLGKITHDSARVLIEVNTDSTVTAVLTATTQTATQPQEFIENHNSTLPEVTVELKFQAGVPRCFQFIDLQPETIYRLSFLGVSNSDDRIGTVRTFKEHTTFLRAVCAACDKPKNRGKTNLFQKLYEDYIEEGKLDLFVRHGDQVYADSGSPNAFNDGKVILNDESLTSEQKHAKMVQGYMDKYRQTYNFPFTRLCMANVMTLCMWDDHELRNDWGTFRQDNDPTSVDYIICLAAREAYWLYQRQLWEDVDDLVSGERVATFECNFHVWGDVGLCFVDNRGGRSFYSDTNPQSPNYITDAAKLPEHQDFLGSVQYKMLFDAVGEAGIFSTVQSLLIVQTIPLANLATCASKCIGNCIPVQTDKMGWGMHPEEQTAWINAIDEWKQRPIAVENGDDNAVVLKRKAKDVLVIGGDLHFGVRTTVRTASDNRVVLEQVVTSAISNKPPPNIIYYLINRCCLADLCCCLLGGKYKANHRDFLPQQNFLLVTAGSAEKDTADFSNEFVSGPKDCCNKRCA